MDSITNPVFKVLIGIIGDYICALLIEKGVSLLQNRKFNRRYAFGIFLLILAGTSLISGVWKEVFLKETGSCFSRTLPF